MLRLLLSASALMSSAALSTVPPPATPQALEPAAEKPKKVCVNIEVPGSNMKRRVCRTAQPKGGNGAKAEPNSAESKPN